MSTPRDRRRQIVGRYSNRERQCGLCGRLGFLTRTHVPPQCAGNTGSVKRFQLVSDPQNMMESGRERIGGIHFFGLCRACNGLQSKWDPAYCTFAKSLWPFALAGKIVIPSARCEMPSERIQPGAIARGVMVSCFALNPNLRTTFPNLADELHSEVGSIRLPHDTALYIGVARGPQALVTGSISGFHMNQHLANGSPLETMCFAQIFFPPLAWQFASVSLSPLLEKEVWTDVSAWLLRDSKDIENLSGLLPALPFVSHPSFGVDSAAFWSEVFHNDSCFIVKSDDAVLTIRAKLGYQ